MNRRRPGRPAPGRTPISQVESVSTLSIPHRPGESCYVVAVLADGRRVVWRERGIPHAMPWDEAMSAVSWVRRQIAAGDPPVYTPDLTVFAPARSLADRIGLAPIVAVVDAVAVTVP